MNDFCTQLRCGYEHADTNVSAGLVVAVSGGADSVAALLGTLEIFPSSHEQIVVAHVNHALRSLESDKDAEFVQDLAHQCQLKFFQKDLKPGLLTEARRGSIEENARAERYQFFAEVIDETGFSAVVTAHHQSDQAETILHNVIRGTGIRGLAGMKPCRTTENGAKIIRPMLNIPREVTRDYLEERKCEFRQDATNTDLNFTRNRIRHELLPLLEGKFNAQAMKNLVNLGRQAADLGEALDYVARDYLQLAVLEQQANSCRLRTESLKPLPESLICHLLVFLWDQQAWSRQKMTAAHWRRLASAIQGKGEKMIDLPHGFRFSVKAGRLHVCRREH